MNLEHIKNIAVLGTGAMAPGIVQLCAQAGYHTTMWGRTDDSLQRGFDRLKANLRTCLDNDLISQGDDELVLSRIEGVKTLEEAASGADFVIESVAEQMALKKEIFARLDKICHHDTILSTNTSGLGITEIASTASRPQRMIVTHFWNPPHLVPLVEIVRGEKTSRDTIKVAIDLMMAIGKEPVMVQKEVGDAIVATPGKMTLLAVSLQVYSKPRIVSHVLSQSFYPPPKVDSAIVRFDLLPEPAIKVADMDSFFEVVRYGFNSPRKQLRNSLAQGLGVKPTAVALLLEKAGVEHQRRAETLSLEEWARLYEVCAASRKNEALC